MKELRFSFDRTLNLETIPCIRAFPFKPYHYFVEALDPGKLSLFFLKDLAGFQTTPNHYLLIAERDGKVVGVCAFLKSDWDSGHFGFPCGAIKYLLAEGSADASLAVKSAMLKHVLDRHREDKMDFLHCRMDKADDSSIRALAENGFQPVTTLVRHVVLSNSIMRVRESLPHVGPAQGRDSDRIKEISRHIFRDNRFFLDKGFHREKVEQIYAIWAEKSCRGKKQDKVFVYWQDKKVVGFATCGLRKNHSEGLSKKIGAIDLVGVDPQYHNRGIAVKIVNSAMAWLKSNADVSEAVMAEQNLPMIRILEHFGFTRKATQIDFHKWMTP